MIAFPIIVARKNSQNGIPNWPHIIPARSNKGFGTYKIFLLANGTIEDKNKCKEILAPPSPPICNEVILNAEIDCYRTRANTK